MSVVEEVRKEREDLARVLKKHTGIRKIVEDLYPDSAHFIYELLQNAEDAKNEQGIGASEASFILQQDRLIFEHNGRAFDKPDIEAITDIGEGTKSEDEDKIGRFGVGFKAVFAYCETPHIWSPTFSFKIEDLVLPCPLDAKNNLGGKTCFEFPFNNPKKSREAAYAEIEAGLRELAETTLLFLSDLESIRWKIGENASGEVLRIEHTQHHVEVLKQVDGETTTSSHFLKFEQPVLGLEKQRIAVAYALDFLPNIQVVESSKPLAKQFRIVPANPGHVAVFFPAGKETSGLRFHLHAPFVPELSRASIKETPANDPLFQQLAMLAAASLRDIRDFDLLSADFLGVLPNPQDSLPRRYEGIRSAIVDAMNAQPLTPTHSKVHAPAAHLLQSRASLKELLSEDDIGYLARNDEYAPQWATARALQGTNNERFMKGLAITDWDIEQFVDLIKEGVGGSYSWQKPDDDFLDWLSNKSVEWHQQLYALLYEELAPKGELFWLKNAQIVRLTDGSYGLGGKCFFPGGELENSEVLPRVDIGAYTSGKSKLQKGKARKFLEEIGVRNVGESEKAEAILKQRYTKEAEIPDKKTYRRDIRFFVDLVEKEPNAARLFLNYWMLEGKDGWGRPDEVFLDLPFMDTGLSAYYEAFAAGEKRVALADYYLNCGVSTKKLANFAKSIGVQTRLEITPITCHSNPQWSYLVSVGGERNTSPRNRDYQIGALEEILAKPSLDLSKLVWQTMCLRPDSSDYLKATYQRSQSWGAHYADSQLVHQLRKAAWVPQGEGSFVRPADASRDLLPEGFPFDPGWPWIKAISFGEEMAKREQERNRQSEEARKTEGLAKELGFADTESLELARRFTELPREEQERILADSEPRGAPELPEHEPANPTRRSERVGVSAVEAPERTTEERTRSVSVGRDVVKDEAAQYLGQQYTNSDGEMICQVCKGPLPFRLDDGTSFFERVEFLTELRKRHYQNYLALCPNHAAMFQYANGSAALMQDMLLDLKGNNLEIVLAQKDAEIYFTTTHIADLKTVIRTNAAEIQGHDGPPGRTDDGAEE